MASNEIFKFHIPKWEELPNIELYLDQVVIILQEYLEPYIGNKEEKIITKTMVNNYVKQEILLPPVKKKYKKEHIAYLFVICVLKQVYSINDIKELIKLAMKDNDVGTAYNKFCASLEKAIQYTFEEKKYNEEENMTEEKHLLKKATLSFANKLYVERKFLYR